MLTDFPKVSFLNIAQDSLGFKWFATPEALNRFDGSEFKIFQ